MSACRSEGELRALIDRELPGEQASAIQQHLAQCAGCTAAYQSLSQRAAFVGSLMDTLSEEIPAGVEAARLRPRRAVFWATAALAATLLFALVLSRHAANRPAQAIVEPPPAPAYVEPPPEPQPVRLPVASASVAESPRVHRIPSRRPLATPVQYYMALDEEPIDTGLVMRVALPSGVQADVIVDGDGRARAIRPVSTLVKEER